MTVSVIDTDYFTAFLHEQDGTEYAVVSATPAGGTARTLTWRAEVAPNV